MTRKHLNSRGSTLVVLVIVITILIMLGVSILTLSVNNFKMKTVYGKVATNQYLSEAGIEEIYGTIGSIVDEAIKKGNERAEEVIQIVNTLDIENEILLEPENRYSNSKGIPYVNDDGSIDMRAVVYEQNMVFKSKYQEYIEENLVSGINETILDIEYEGLRPEIEIIADSLEIEENSISIGLKSTFINDEIEKAISATYKIIVPYYNESYLSRTNLVEVPINPVWSRAITVGKDMEIDSNNLEFYGDIYVKGINSESGGIGVVNNDLIQDDIDININGSVITSEGFKINGSNRSIKIDGNLYAKNLVISEASLNSKILLQDKDGQSGSAYLMDDLELNGLSSVVDIEGGFYGLSDGSDSSTPDKSSSIVINSIDIGEENGSRLNIEGDTIIWGSSYITDLGEENSLYQTGESISIRGNYRAYTYPIEFYGEIGENDLFIQSDKESDGVVKIYEADGSNYKPKLPLDITLTNDEIQYILKDGSVRKVGYEGRYADIKIELYNNLRLDINPKNNTENKFLNLYIIKGQDVSDRNYSIVDEYGNTKSLPNNINEYYYANNLNKDNLRYDEYGPLKLYSGFKDSNALNIFDKSYYLRFYHDEYSTMSGLNLGKGVSINRDKLFIHSGAVVFDGNIEPSNFHPKYESEIREKASLYEKYVVNMETDNPTSIDNQINYNHDRFNSLNGKNINGNELIILDSDNNEDYVLMGEGYETSKLPSDIDEHRTVYLNNSSINGIIVTKGDIYILGEINFNGTIITEGNLYVRDNNKKLFSYNQKLIARIIGKYHLEDIFRNNYSNVATELVEINDGDIQKSGSYITKDKLIKLKDWKIER